MMDLDQDTWIYLALIAIAAVYFFWNYSKAQQNRKTRKNHNFSKRYLERKKGDQTPEY